MEPIHEVTLVDAPKIGDVVADKGENDEHAYNPQHLPADQALPEEDDNSDNPGESVGQDRDSWELPINLIEP